VSNPAEAVCRGIRHGATKVPVTLVIVHVVKLSPTWITFPYNITSSSSSSSVSRVMAPWKSSSYYLTFFNLPCPATAATATTTATTATA